jgi:hypothetical protein
MVFIGIDPGVGGGLASVNDDGEPLEYCKMPETPADVVRALRSMRRFYPGRKHTRALLERVSSSPKMGVSSAFTFGKGYGVLTATLEALEISYELVESKRWQNHHGCRQPKGTKFGESDKNITKTRAQNIFPDVKVTHAIADALLIADFCRHVHQTTPSTRPHRGNHGEEVHQAGRTETGKAGPEKSDAPDDGARPSRETRQHLRGPRRKPREDERRGDERQRPSAVRARLHPEAQREGEPQGR